MKKGFWLLRQNPFFVDARLGLFAEDLQGYRHAQGDLGIRRVARDACGDVHVDMDAVVDLEGEARQG